MDWWKDAGLLHRSSPELKCFTRVRRSTLVKSDPALSAASSLLTRTRTRILTDPILGVEPRQASFSSTNLFFFGRIGFKIDCFDCPGPGRITVIHCNLHCAILVGKALFYIDLICVSSSA